VRAVTCRAASKEPDDAEAYNNRGAVYAHKGDYKSAVADFDTAILLAPKDAVAYKNRGNAYSLMGETDLAIADFTEAIRLNPNFETAHKALAKLNAVPA
jgi:tetratricopeptide (TPR) repeat protein